MTFLRARKRASTLSVKSVMSSTKVSCDFSIMPGYRSVLHLLLLGILLQSVLVSGQTTSSSAGATTATASSTMTSGAKTTGTMMLSSSANTMTAASTSQSPTSGGTMMASTTQASTVTGTSGGSASTSVKATTMPASSGGSISTTPSAGSMTMAQSTNPSSSMTSGSSNTMMSTSQPSNSTGMSGMGTTNMYGSSMGVINCPSFSCNYSDCYSMYMSQNTTTCTPGACCELIRQTDMYYTVGCSSSCSNSCFNASQTNCSVNCCNSTGCLNGSFASMMMTTTAMPTTKRAMTTPMATTTTTKPQTTANKGNKCHKGTCTGTDCYKTFKVIQTCLSSEPHCQLKKEKADSSFKWTAGCTKNCSRETPCKAKTDPPCHLECCNATMTSCLLLNGTMNVPNAATRGPHLNTELITSFLSLLALALLL